MKPFLKILCVTLLLSSAPSVSHAACNILIDGSPVAAVDANGAVVEPFIENGTTYVPVRAVANAFNTDISWDQETRTIYIGKNASSASLGDNINIYYNGSPFTAVDANGDSVYPILKSGTTYLPIRAIGSLFGKTVSWDSVSQTVSLSMPCPSEALSYFRSALLNTEITKDVTVDVSFNGKLLSNGSVISEKNENGSESYSSSAFSLSSFLPANYDEYLSYLGNGKFFLNAPSESFSSSLNKLLDKFGADASFSNLYISVETNGGYITDIAIHASGTLQYSNAVLEASYSITGTVKYPEDFTFPSVSFPEGGASSSEKEPDAEEDADVQKPEETVSETNEDDAPISALVSSCIDNIINHDASKISSLLSAVDYNDLFGSRSTSQLRLDFNTANKKLTSKYSGADGSYTIDSIDYSSPDSDKYENEAKITVSVLIFDGDNARADEVVLTLVKSNGKWYLSKESMQNIMN
jgi:hypothetical protein